MSNPAGYPNFEAMNELQRRLHNAACVLEADGDEYGYTHAIREAVARIATLEQESQQMKAGTPASTWRTDGKPDPHGNRYDCERAQLCMGDHTDDELANEVFLYGNTQRTAAELIAGKMPAIAYLTAAKDRIRWLSRKLQEALAAQPAIGVAEAANSEYQRGFKDGYQRRDDEVMGCLT